MSQPDDASLVRAAQAGDNVSLGTLLERHRALLLAVAVGMLGHGPQAEDAVHDTFVLALRRIGLGEVVPAEVAGAGRPRPSGTPAYHRRAVARDGGTSTAR